MVHLHFSSEQDKYFLIQLHSRLGVIVKEDFSFAFERSSHKEHGGLILKSNSETKRDLAIENGKDLIIYSDILLLLKDNLTLSKEENLDIDQYGRPIYEEERNHTYKEPKLDETVSFIRKSLIDFLKKNKIAFLIDTFPGRPTVCLSHDVDSLKGRSFVRAFVWLLKGFIQARLLFFLRKIYSLVEAKEDYHDSLEFCSELEKKYNFRSTFFFLSLPFFLSHEGRRYRINKRIYVKKINQLLEEGFEVALHTSRKGFLLDNFLNREINRLRSIIKKNISGVRNHYLSGSFPGIWRKYELHNFKYDSSLGFTDRPGYRAETANPFRPYNLYSSEEFEILEIPLILMDTTLNDQSAELIFENCKPYLDQALKSESLITILWHTDRIYNPDYKNYCDAYVMILDYLQIKNFDSKTCSEIAKLYGEYLERMKKNIIIYEN